MGSDRPDGDVRKYNRTAALQVRPTEPNLISIIIFLSRDIVT